MQQKLWYIAEKYLLIYKYSSGVYIIELEVIFTVESSVFEPTAILKKLKKNCIRRFGWSLTFISTKNHFWELIAHALLITSDIFNILLFDFAKMKEFAILLLYLAAFANAACVRERDCHFYKKFDRIAREFDGNVTCIKEKAMENESLQVLFSLNIWMSSFNSKFFCRLTVRRWTNITSRSVAPSLNLQKEQKPQWMTWNQFAWRSVALLKIWSKHLKKESTLVGKTATKLWSSYCACMMN